MNKDIEERTFEFSVKLINHTKGVSRNTATDVILKQLMRSGTSIGANVTEGRASASRKDFINFHYHALKSARETIYWLRLLQITPGTEHHVKEQEMLRAEASEISKIIGKIVVNSRNNTKV